MQKKVSKKVLSNGLTVLVRPVTTIPKVSTQLWYHVGAKAYRDWETDRKSTRLNSSH